MKKRELKKIQATLAEIEWMVTWNHAALIALCEENNVDAGLLNGFLHGLLMDKPLCQSWGAKRKRRAAREKLRTKPKGEIVKFGGKFTPGPQFPKED